MKPVGTQVLQPFDVRQERPLFLSNGVGSTFLLGLVRVLHDLLGSTIQDTNYSGL